MQNQNNEALLDKISKLQEALTQSSQSKPVANPGSLDAVLEKMEKVTTRLDGLESSTKRRKDLGEDDDNDDQPDENADGEGPDDDDVWLHCHPKRRQSSSTFFAWASSGFARSCESSLT